MKDITDWLDAEGTPQAHEARDLIEALRQEVTAQKILLAKQDELLREMGEALKVAKQACIDFELDDTHTVVDKAIAKYRRMTK
jgi:hypothetical protein